MKRKIIAISGLVLLLLANTLCVQCYNQLYYGRTLSQIMDEDAELKLALEQISCDVRFSWVHMFPFCSPSEVKIERLKENIAILQQRIEYIEECLQEAKDRMQKIKNGRGFISSDAPDACKAAAPVLFFPFIIFDGIAHNRKTAKIQEARKKMVEAKLELEKKINMAQRFLHRFSHLR